MLLTQALNRWIRLSFTLHSSFRFSSLPLPLLHLFPFLSISSPLLCSFIYHKYSNHVNLSDFTFRALLSIWRDNSALNVKSLNVKELFFFLLFMKKVYLCNHLYVTLCAAVRVYSMWINLLIRMCVSDFQFVLRVEVTH